MTLDDNTPLDFGAIPEIPFENYKLLTNLKN